MASTINGIKIPSAATLRRYGLSLLEWKAHGIRQGWVCSVCGKKPKNGRLVIDHHHAPGWKSMPAEERKTYVRGLVDWFCNHYYLARGINPDKAFNVYVYLRDYEERRRQTEH